MSKIYLYFAYVSLPRPATPMISMFSAYAEILLPSYRRLYLAGKLRLALKQLGMVLTHPSRACGDVKRQLTHPYKFYEDTKFRHSMLLEATLKPTRRWCESMLFLRIFSKAALVSSIQFYDSGAQSFTRYTRQDLIRDIEKGCSTEFVADCAMLGSTHSGSSLGVFSLDQSSRFTTCWLSGGLRELEIPLHSSFCYVCSFSASNVVCASFLTQRRVCICATTRLCFHVRSSECSDIQRTPGLPVGQFDGYFYWENWYYRQPNFCTAVGKIVSLPAVSLEPSSTVLILWRDSAHNYVSRTHNRHCQSHRFECQDSAL